MSSASLSVRSVSGRTGSRDWLDVPARVFAGDPVWVTPLRMVEKQRISPKHNPFFEHGEAQLFVAYRGGMPIGRISAQINRLHLAHHDDRTGHFGFFDCVDDPEAAAMLVCAARGWLRARGMTRMAGPVSFSINEDIGLLVAGFDQRPSILTSHAHRYSGPLLEASGLAKAIDLFAWRMQPREIPPMIQRLARLAGAASSRIRVRPFDMSCYEREVGVVFDIFNDAWSENWGFVPFTKTEVAKLARETRPIMRSDFGRIIELDGEPVAMIVMLPDINDLIGSFRGRLLPFNWLKLALAIKAGEFRTARIPLMGLRKSLRGTPLAAGMLSMMVAACLDVARRHSFQWVEFSWVLETNGAMVSIAQAAAGAPCRVYRVYEADL